MDDLVSVVIITYKRPLEVLGRAIESVIKQSYRNIELFVVNDAPEEIDLANQLRDYVNNLADTRVQYIQHEINKGANAARNTGLRHARGKYICFLDDDDEWISNKVELQLQYMKPGVGLVYSPFYVRGNNVEKIANFNLPDDPLKAILEGNYIGSTSFPMLLTSAVKEAGGFDETFASCQEYDLWIRITSKYSVCKTDKPVGYYYLSNDSTFKKPDKYVKGIDAVIAKHSELYKKHPRQLSNRYMHMAFAMLKKKELRRYASYKRKAVKADRSNPNNILFLYLINKIKARRQK